MSGPEEGPRLFKTTASNIISRMWWRHASHNSSRFSFCSSKVQAPLSRPVLLEEYTNIMRSCTSIRQILKKVLTLDQTQTSSGLPVTRREKSFNKALNQLTGNEGVRSCRDKHFSSRNLKKVVSKFEVCIRVLEDIKTNVTSDWGIAKHAIIGKPYNLIRAEKDYPTRFITRYDTGKREKTA
ncbi:unnamed protein product [Nesidiocoris tenuis]|uniref:Uncharacterized protein n=1 Tax=Nesidiocoris tenuis TaxID=355587 RepID=A0A6H5G0T2_9HEMI|nr:unnamed protein product [Nesidiocoris tenuis]